MRLVSGIVALLIAALIASLVFGSFRWNRASNAAIAVLGSSSSSVRDVYREVSLDGLPPPAARYFRKVLTDGQPIVRSVAAEQEAEFFINGAWRPLEATQQFTTAPPGFVWDARIEMAPLIPASVRDSYVGGRGAMQASIFGVYSLADQAGNPELNAGALQRYLGEAIWFPTALLPSSTVTWSPRDDSSATVTLSDGATSVSLLFEFNGRDGVVRITGDRFKEGGGAYTLQPWQILCGEHERRDLMTIPLRCEVSWLTDGGAEPYWRGRISAITYGYN